METQGNTRSERATVRTPIGTPPVEASREYNTHIGTILNHRRIFFHGTVFQCGRRIIFHRNLYRRSGFNQFGHIIRSCVIN